MKDVFNVVRDSGHLSPVLHAVLFDPRRDWVKAIMLKYSALSAACGVSLQSLLDEFIAAISCGDPSLAYHGGQSGKFNRCKVTEQDSVTLTCRSLTLDRFLRLGKPKGMSPFSWSSLEGPDNYTHCLGIEESELAQWAGMQVLDIGCGQSMFASEASVFGIHVTGADLMVGAFPKRPLLCQYAKNQLFLAVLQSLQIGVDPGVLCCADVSVLQRMWRDFPAIYRHYAAWRPVTADVLALSTTFADNRFDVCLSSYLFCYLSSDRKIVALRNLARTTKVGGQIRICAGMSGIDAGSTAMPEPKEIQLDDKELVLASPGSGPFVTYLVRKK